MHIVGILNVTRDSFSDGGRYLDPDTAVAHGLELSSAGAAIIDVGAESTHPDAHDVPDEEQIRRLAPVVRQLKAEGVTVSIDTHRPAVMAAMLELGADWINDVTALADPEAVAVLRGSDARIVLMHAVRTPRGNGGGSPARAEAIDTDADSIVPRIERFFRQRLDALTEAGISPERVVLDPGMGFFLGRDPAVSLRVLRALPKLGQLGRPLWVSTSRKSFIGQVLGTPDEPRPTDRRWAGTLATELWAAARGASYIRTHDVAALADAWRLWQAIERQPPPDPGP